MKTPQRLAQETDMLIAKQRERMLMGSHQWFLKLITPVILWLGAGETYSKKASPGYTDPITGMDLHFGSPLWISRWYTGSGKLTYLRIFLGMKVRPRGDISNSRFYIVKLLEGF